MIKLEKKWWRNKEEQEKEGGLTNNSITDGGDDEKRTIMGDEAEKMEFVSLFFDSPFRRSNQKEKDSF